MISLRQTAAYSLAKIVPGLITFTAVPILVSTIGASGYGIYSSSWALTTFATSFTSGWLRCAALRATGNRENAMGRIPMAIFVLLAIAPAPPVMIWTVIAASLDTDGTSLAAALSGGAFAAANGCYLFVTTRTQRDGRAIRFAVAEAFRAGLGLLGAVGLSQLASFPKAASALLGYAIATMIATLIAAGPGLPPLTRRVNDWLVLRSYWRYGWPMSLWLAASTGLVYADRFVVTVLLGPVLAGQYAAIADLTIRGVAMVTSPIIMTLHPSVMRAWNGGDTKRAIEELRRGMQILVPILALSVVGSAMVGPALVRIVVHQYVSWLILGGLAFGAAAWQLGQLAHKPYELVSKNGEMLAVAIVAMLGTLFLEVVLTPIVGLGGPVIALCAGASGYTIVCAVGGKRLLPSQRSASNDDKIEKAASQQ